MTTMSNATVWAVMIGAGVGTLLIRFSFLALVGKERTIHPVVERALRLVPPAVLATLAIPALVRTNGALDISFDNLRLLAGLAAGVVAWRTKNLFLTIATGMAVLWILQAVT